MNKQKESTANEIIRLSENIKSFDIERDLIRTQVLGTQWDFQELYEDFQTVYLIIEDLLSVDLKVLPLPLLSDLSLKLTGVYNSLNNIKLFNVVPQSDLEKIKQTSINSFNTEFEKFNQTISKVSTLLQIIKNKTLLGSTKSNILSEEQQKIIDVTLSQAKEVTKQLDKAQIEMNNALAAVKAKAKEVGISRYSDIFGEESETNKKTSGAWLAATFFLLFVGIGYLVNLNYNLNEIVNDKEKIKLLENNNYILQISFIRIISITILFYAITICIKNFRAQKHNQVINKHRQNALTTFETFSAGASDEQTKNAVLLEATRAIFGNQSTGFSNKDGDAEGPTNQVIEIFKARSESKTTS